MKVGTDGVLLGAWCGVTAGRALDVGTGTGLVALMVAQRSPGAAVDAVEIDGASASQAAENFAASPWGDRLNVVNASFQKFCATTSARYDLIVSNPPYFIGSLPSPDSARNAARHNASLSHDDLLDGVAGLLAPGGTFCVILPRDLAEKFVETARDRSLGLTRTTAVHPTPEKEAARALMEFTHGFTGDPLRETLVVETARHRYTPEYIALTGDFYLKM